MRNLGALAAVVGLLVTLGGVKAAEIGKLISFGKKAQSEGPPAESVATAVTSKQSWEATISDVGTATSSKGVTLSSEVPGMVTRILFESGDMVKKGTPLVELDTNVERSQLGAAIARRELASINLDRTSSLIASNSIAQQQLDTDKTQLQVTKNDVNAIRAQIALKNVRAAFDGQLGIRLVNVGQYLAAGAPITVLERIRPLFVDFTTPQERVSQIAIGMPVRIVLSTQGGAERQGRIDAIEPAVDTTTRTVRVRASVPNEDGAIKPGMFVRVTVLLPQRAEVVVAPATSILHASFGDSVFIVEDKPPSKVVRQQFVRIGETRGDFIEIKEGLAPGQEIVSAGAFKLRNGSRVRIDNTGQPEPQLHPNPPNR